MLYDYSSKVAPRRRYGLQQTDERGWPLVKTRALCGVRLKKKKKTLEINAYIFKKLNN